MATVRIACAQVISERYDVRANLTKLRVVVERAAADGADIVIFPEMFLTGYTVWDRVHELAEPLDGRMVDSLREQARQSGVLLVCGLPEQGANRRVFNSAAVIDRDGTLLGSHRKCHLFADEGSVFTAGDGLAVFRSSIGTLGVMICYDLEFPESARSLAVGGAKCLLVSTANMIPYAKYQEVFTQARAMENALPLAIANTVGDDGTFRYFGESAIVSPSGEWLARAGANEEVLAADAEFGAEIDDGNLAYLSRRRPDIYSELVTP